MKVVFAYAVYILYGLIFTFANIPFHGLTPVMTRDAHERSILVSVKQICSIIGGVIARSAPVMIVAQFDNPEEGWRLTGILFGVMAGDFLPNLCL